MNAVPSRRRFLRDLGLSAAALAGLGITGRSLRPPLSPLERPRPDRSSVPRFSRVQHTVNAGTARVERVVVVRFGGGIRNHEAFGAGCEARFLKNALLPEGTLYPNLWLDREAITGHAQGTLGLLTGRWDRYPGGPFDKAYIPRQPTVFERVRAAYRSDLRDCVYINNADNLAMEFLAWSEAPELASSETPALGRTAAPLTLSGWALARRRFERQLAGGGLSRPERRRLLRQQERHLEAAYRPPITDPALDAFLDQLDADFGQAPPAGDELVGELAVRALTTWRPRLLFVGLLDCDFVHWGPAHLYQRGVRRMDGVLARIWRTIQLHPALAGSTALIVAPDHGRNEHGHTPIPYQHHDTENPAAHHTFAFLAGPGLARGRVVDEERGQVDVMATICALLGVDSGPIHGRPLEGAWA